MIHSATPWRISQGRDKVRPNEIRDANDDPIGAISPKADADLIVRAVNHHADLVQALRDMVRALNNANEHGVIFNISNDGQALFEAGDRADALLARINADAQS